MHKNIVKNGNKKAFLSYRYECTFRSIESILYQLQQDTWNFVDVRPVL